MAFLRLLQSVRLPILDKMVDIATYMGDEVFFMLVGLLLLWCINKKWGFRLLFVGMLGTNVNQLLKGIFCVPRPWILDPAFEIVESARAGATGYSFPSGHTHSAVSVFGTLAFCIRKKWMWLLAALMVLVVAFSRMYLGVHTPYDVGASLVLGTVCVIAMVKLFDRTEASEKQTLTVAGGVALMSLLVLFYILFGPKSARNVAEFDLHGAESMGKMAGAAIGLTLAWWLDMRFIRFDTRAPWWAQIVKVVLGAGLVVLIKSGMKPVFVALLGDNVLSDAVRYFAIAVFGGALWPMTFRWYKAK